MAFNTTWGLWKGDYTADPILSNNDIYNPGVQSISNNITYTVGVDGNIESDPLFMNASGSNYHLQGGSPCIDAGDDSAGGLVSTDLDGHPRIIGAHVDIGAYEYDNPGVTISPATGQSVPAASSPINFTVTFTQIVTGFTSAGVTLSGTAGATTTTVTDSGDHMNYSVGVTGMANNGTVILSVTSGAAHNSYGDGNAPSSYTIVYLGFATSTIYVNQNATGTGDGSSWTNAAPTITDGLSAAHMGDQVWVEAGTYAENVTVPDGVALYGGFAGGETSLSQRNVRANVTTISDSAGAAVYMNTSMAAAIVDGFTITTNCQGIFCTGTGIATISNNVVVLSSGQVGIYAYCCSQANILANSISGASSEGIYCLDSGITVENNLVTGASIGMYVRGSYGPVANNTLTANVTGLRTTVSSNTISNNIIAFNSSYGVLCNRIMSGQTLSHNDVYGNPHNYQGPSPGATDISADPLFVDSAGSDYHLQAGSPCIDAGDDTAVDSSGLERDLDGNPRIIGSHVDIGAYEYDPPSATVAKAANQPDPTNTSPINFTVIFSQPVFGLDSSGVAISGSAGATTALITDSGDHATYNVAVSGMVDDGTVSVSVPASAAHDADGYSNTASTDTNNSVTYNCTFSAISDVIQNADGIRVRLYGRVVTAVFTDSLYVEDVDSAINLGVRGIQVVYSGASSVTEVGESVDVYGVLATTGGQRCITNASITTSSDDIQPLWVYAMSNRSVGGGDWLYNSTSGAGQQGITGAYGWNNIGLLIKSWGVVTAVDSSGFSIDDGSAINIRVIAPDSAGIPDVDAYVSVVGISSCQQSGSNLNPLIRARSDDDIVVLQPEANPVTVQLAAGQNLIGLPLVPVSPDPAVLFADIPGGLGSNSLIRTDPASGGNIAVRSDRNSSWGVVRQHAAWRGLLG